MNKQFFERLKYKDCNKPDLTYGETVQCVAQNKLLRGAKESIKMNNVVIDLENDEVAYMYSCMELSKPIRANDDEQFYHQLTNQIKQNADHKVKLFDQTIIMNDGRKCQIMYDYNYDTMDLKCEKK